MAFEAKKYAYTPSIGTVIVGTGEKAAVLGGNHTLPFYSFDAPAVHAPVIGMEIPDSGISAFSLPGLSDFYRGCSTPAEMAERASGLAGVSFLCLHLLGAEPNGENRSVEECVAIAVSVSEASDLPLAILGCKNAEKDALVFAALSTALEGKNVLLLSAQEENYQKIGALPGRQKLGAESAVDINLAKQLNVLLTQLGVPADGIVMNAGSAAAGYGYEYVASTLERIRLAALAQGDDLLQMPVITPVSSEVWAVKESQMSEEEMPEWGNPEECGIEMEITTASACLVSGSDAVILRHPASVRAIAAMIDALV